MIRARADVEAFARLVEALRPCLDDLVFIGGWAHRLYRSHPLAQRLEYPPLMTRDADVAVPPPTPLAVENIRERLLAAGFQEEFSGEQRPPVTRYQLGSEYGGFYTEFVTPLMGSDHKRDGSLDATTSIAGVSAQRLRYLDLLLVAPWSVRLDGASGFPISPQATARVPNVASYLAQKILIHSKRATSQQAKDVLYIHDTIELFGRSLTEVRADWTLHVKPKLGGRALKRVEKSVDAMFAEISDGVRAAAREATAASGRTLSPGSIAEVCRVGLNAILVDSG